MKVSVVFIIVRILASFYNSSSVGISSSDAILYDTSKQLNIHGSNIKVDSADLYLLITPAGQDALKINVDYVIANSTTEMIELKLLNDRRYLKLSVK